MLRAIGSNVQELLIKPRAGFSQTQLANSARKEQLGIGKPILGNRRMRSRTELEKQGTSVMDDVHCPCDLSISGMDECRLIASFVLKVDGNQRLETLGSTIHA